MRAQGTFSGPWIGGGRTPFPVSPRRFGGTYRGAWTSSRKYIAGRSVMPPDLVAALNAYPDRRSQMGIGDDGYYSSGESGELSGIFGSIGKAVKGVAKGVAKVATTAAKGVAKGAVFAAKNVGTVAPFVATVLPVAAPVAAAIGAGSKIVSGIARKKSAGQIAVEAAEGAVIGGAGRAIVKKTDLVGKVKGLFKGKTPEEKAAAQAEKVAKQQRDAEVKAQRASDKAAKKQADAERKAQEAQTKKDARSARLAERAAQEAEKAAADAANQQSLLDQIAKLGTQVAAQAASGGGGGGGGGGGSPFGGGGPSAAPAPETQVQEAGIMGSMPSWALPALAIGLAVMSSGSSGSRSRGRRR